jgi:hypothetical protein
MVIDKPMLFAATVYIKSDDLSLGVDAVRKGASGPGKVDDVVDAVTVKEPLFGAVLTLREIPGKLSLGIDGYNGSREATRRIDRCVIAVVFDETNALTAIVVGIDYVRPNDLSLGVDAVGIGVEGSWNVDRGVCAMIVEEAVVNSITISVNPDDLSLGIDACGFGTVDAARGVYRRVDAVVVQEAVRRTRAVVLPKDLSLRVDAKGDGFSAARGVDCRVGTMAFEEAVCCVTTAIVFVFPDDLSLGIDAVGAN